MNGSIRFNPDINIEVSVDPAAEEGARLLSAKNLVDGQEAGGGGGGASGLVTYTEDVGIDKTYNELINMATAEVVPYFIYEGKLFVLSTIIYNSQDELYAVDFTEVLTTITGLPADVFSFSSEDADTPMYLD